MTTVYRSFPRLRAGVDRNTFARLEREDPDLAADLRAEIDSGATVDDIAAFIKGYTLSDEYASFVRRAAAYLAAQREAQ